MKDNLHLAGKEQAELILAKVEKCKYLQTRAVKIRTLSNILFQPFSLSLLFDPFVRRCWVEGLWLDRVVSAQQAHEGREANKTHNKTV